MKQNSTRLRWLLSIPIFIIIVLLLSLAYRHHILRSGLTETSIHKVQYALFFGARPSFQFKDQEQLIFLAIRNSENEDALRILRFCLEIPTEYGYSSWGETLLTEALIEKRYEFAKVLIEEGIQVLISNVHGYKPVLFAMDHPIIKALVDQGGEIHNIDPDGNSVFHWSFGWTTLAFFYSADPEIVNDRNSYGIPPLIAALIRRDSVQFANLLDLGASPHVSDAEGKFAMSYAAELGSITHYASFLRRKGGDVNQRNTDGTTPVFFVETNKMLQYLVRWGAEIDVVDANRQTPVHYYVVNDHMPDESFELIIDFLDYFVADHLDDRGESAIMYAAQEGKEKRFFTLFNKFEKNGYRFKNAELVYRYALHGQNSRIIWAVEQRVMAERAVSYASRRIIAPSMTSSALIRITRGRLIRRGLGKLLSKAIPGIGTFLLLKDIYDLVNY